jgi:hypothetical protein
MASVAEHLASALDPVRLARRCGLEAEPWQQELLRSKSKRILVLAARQVGKSFMTGLVSLHQAAYTPQSLVLVVSHTQDGSNEFLSRVRAWGRSLGLVDRDSETECRLVNQSRLVALPATVRSTRGYSAANLIVLDECSHIQYDEEVIAGVLPTLRADGRIIALTTAGGARGWFFDRWQDGGSEWERFKIRAQDSKQYTPKRIKDRRAEIGSWAARRDLDCDFAGSGSSYFDFDSIRACLSADTEYFL